MIFIDLYCCWESSFTLSNDEEETIVHAGHMVLYAPREPQKYEYYAKDQVEVYWVHFTGNNVTNLLRSHGLTNDKRGSTVVLVREYQYQSAPFLWIDK